MQPFSRRTGPDAGRPMADEEIQEALLDHSRPFIRSEFSPPVTVGTVICHQLIYLRRRSRRRPGDKAGRGYQARLGPKRGCREV